MEFFDIVDEKGIPTGETIERIQAHKKGVRRRNALQKKTAFRGGSILLPPDIFRRGTSRRNLQYGNFTKNWESRHLKRNCNSPDALIFNTKRNFMEKCFGTTRLHSSICTLSR